MISLASKLRRLLSNRFILGAFVIPNALFWSLTWLLPNGPEIMVLNLMVAGVSTAVIVAYGELIVTTALSGEEPDGGDYVAAGIVYGFGALGLRSVLSLTWRWLGMPMWVMNSEFINALLFAGFMAGLLHYAARGALKGGRVPTARWVRIGTLVGVVVVAGLVLLHASDLLGEWRKWTTPNDLAPTPASYEQSG